MNFYIQSQPKCTVNQSEAIDKLAIDLSISDRKVKLAHISDICGRAITSNDSMTTREASQVIEKFIEWKDNKRAINKELRK